MALTGFYLGAGLFSPVLAGSSSAPLTLYTNAGEQVSYQFPANWPVTEMNQQGKGYIVRMAAIRPSAGDNDPFTENINLVVENIGPTMTLAQYFEANRKNMPSGLKQFKEEKSGNIHTANANGMYMIYSHQYPGVDPRLIHFYQLPASKAFGTPEYHHNGEIRLCFGFGHESGNGKLGGKHGNKSPGNRLYKLG